jgi:lipopolysaccharide export system permease protein
LLYFTYSNLLSLSQAWVGLGKLNFVVGLLGIHMLMITATALLFYSRIRISSVFPWRKK